MEDHEIKAQCIVIESNIEEKLRTKEDGGYTKTPDESHWCCRWQGIAGLCESICDVDAGLCPEQKA